MNRTEKMTFSSRVIVGAFILILSLPFYSQVIATTEDVSNDDENPEYIIEWANEEIIADWDSSSGPYVPIGKALTHSIAPSGDFIVSVHSNACFSLVWTDQLENHRPFPMQVYCVASQLINGLQFQLPVSSIAISPDESTLAVCTNAHGTYWQGGAPDEPNVYLIPIHDFPNHNFSHWNGVYSRVGYHGLLSTEDNSLAICDSIGFDNETGEVVTVWRNFLPDDFDGQCRITLTDNEDGRWVNLPISSRGWFMLDSLLTTYEGRSCTDDGNPITIIFNASDQRIVDIEQIGNVTWGTNPANPPFLIWFDSISGNFGYGRNSTILQNDPDFLEMMAYGGIAYQESNGLWRYSISISERTTDRDRTYEDYHANYNHTKREGWNFGSHPEAILDSFAGGKLTYAEASERLQSNHGWSMLEITDSLDPLIRTHEASVELARDRSAMGNSGKRAMGDFAPALLLLIVPLFAMFSTTANSVLSSTLGSLPLISKDAITRSHYSQWDVEQRDLFRETSTLAGQGIISIIAGVIYATAVLTGYAIYIAGVIVFYAIYAYLIISGVVLLALGYVAGIICFLPIVLLAAIAG